MASRAKAGTRAFSPQTLEKFEAASASIPIRQLDRAFESADLRPGADPGGPEGSRRAQFRRYVTHVDQDDPRQLERLGNALGALIAEVATSKEEFLIRAAESDGFAFAGGVFRPAATAAAAFAVTRPEDLAHIDDRARRLRTLASGSPADAVSGATELVASVCRTVLLLLGERPPVASADTAEHVQRTLTLLDTDRKREQQLVAVLVSFDELRDGGGPKARRAGRPALSPADARLAVATAAALAAFVAETYAERPARSSQRAHPGRKKS